jgi:hypothetical protein
VPEVQALACELPAQSGRALSRWSAAELGREAVARGFVCQVSGTTVWRWLSEDAIRPWAWRSWVFPRDPDFRTKAGRVLDWRENTNVVGRLGRESIGAPRQWIPDQRHIKKDGLSHWARPSSLRERPNP